MEMMEMVMIATEPGNSQYLKNCTQPRNSMGWMLSKRKLEAGKSLTVKLQYVCLY